ncbi:hypothetical protein D3C76_1230770 [compost metagenome]
MDHDGVAPDQSPGWPFRGRGAGHPLPQPFPAAVRRHRHGPQRCDQPDRRRCQHYRAPAVSRGGHRHQPGQESVVHQAPATGQFGHGDRQVHPGWRGAGGGLSPGRGLSADRLCRAQQGRSTGELAPAVLAQCGHRCAVARGAGRARLSPDQVDEEAGPHPGRVARHSGTAARTQSQP